MQSPQGKEDSFCAVIYFLYSIHFLRFLPPPLQTRDQFICVRACPSNQAFLAVLMAAMGVAQAQIGFPDVGKAKGAVRVSEHVLSKAGAQQVGGA
eukprot:scaffold160582_cov19-Tisochrysis_lutea.AAC.2